MRFEIRPHEGIGPIRLGMSRQEVAEVMAHVSVDGPRRSRGDKDQFGLFMVNYDPKQRVEYIACGCHDATTTILFEGIDVFDVPAEELLTHIKQFDSPDPQLSKEGYEYIFPQLILTLWEPDEQYDCKGSESRPVFGSVGIGNASYLAQVREIKAPKGPLDIEWQSSNKPADKHRISAAALKALGVTVGVDEDGEVRSVSFLPCLYGGSPPGDSALQHLQGFLELEAINFGGSGVTDAGLASLTKLVGLKGLMLNTEGITDAGLAQLKGLVNLIELVLPESISSRGLALLQQFPNLRKLSLMLGKNTEDGLHHLAKLAQLRVLSLSDQLTDEGMQQLAQLCHLEELDLASCGQIGDHSLRHLQGLANLRSLSLGIQFSDLGLQHLEALKYLRLLIAFSSKITDQGVASLRKGNPDLQVCR